MRYLSPGGLQTDFALESGEINVLAEFGVKSNLEKEDYLAGLENLNKVW
jgi:hypothetical protein